MFFTLGLLVFPQDLVDVAVKGTIVAFVSVAIARPIATFIATALDRYSFRERVVLGWGGLRGAVPVVLATFPVIEGVPRSHEFFNIAFFAVLLSTLLQGATLEPLARRLGLTTSQPALPRPLADSAAAQSLGAEMVEFPIARGDAIVGFAVRDLGLPREALVNVIVRGGRAIPPRGSTKLASGDVLHILIRSEAVKQIYPLLERWRQGPIRREIARRRGGLDDDARLPRAPPGRRWLSYAASGRLFFEPKFGVWLWQFGHSSSRFSSRLSCRSPLMWWRQRERGRSRHRAMPQCSQRSLSPAVISRSLDVVSGSRRSSAE